MNEKAMEALMNLTQQVYLPAFLKAAQDKGITLENEEDVKNAMETTAMLKLMGVEPGPEGESQLGSAVIKQANEDLAALWQEAFGGSSVDEVKETVSQDQSVKNAAETLIAALQGAK